MNTRATFVRMEDSTPEDWQTITPKYLQFANGLPERVARHLQLLQGDYGGYPIDRYTHSLQAATLALRDGRDDEYVVCTLLHDIGDTLGTFNHSDIAAAILRPFVSEQNHWMVQNHGIFHGHYFFHHLGLDRNLRENFRNHPNFERTVEFCERYDNPAFDPDGETLPVSEFMPMLRRVMAQPRQSIYKWALQPGAAAPPHPFHRSTP